MHELVDAAGSGRASAARRQTLRGSRRSAHGVTFLLASRQQSLFPELAILLGCLLMPAGCAKDATQVQEQPSRAVANGTAVVPGTETEQNDQVADSQADAAKAPTLDAGKPADASADPPPGKYFIEGAVRDQQTAEPVAGAKIQFLVMSETDPEKRLLKGTTDDQGRYRVEVPLGGVMLWFPELKPGYWLESENAKVAIETSPAKPVATHDIVARPGPVWNARLDVEGGIEKIEDWPVVVQHVADDATRRALLKREPVSFQQSPAQSIGYPQPDGTTLLTQIGDSGKLIVGLTTLQTEFLIEPGFDNQHVVKATPIDGTDRTELIDSNGKKATVGLAVVTLHEGRPLLTFKMQKEQPVGQLKVTGRVVDPAGKAISGVRIGCAMGVRKGGSAALNETAITDDAGAFELVLPIYPQMQTVNAFLSLVLNKPGLAAMDTQRVDLPADLSPLDFGDVVMHPGFTLPVRVVDDQGQPLAGVALEPEQGYALRRQGVRTDVAGKAVISDLPSGVVRVTARLGEHVTSNKLVISDDQNENGEATIRLRRAVAAAATSETPAPIAVGQVAPELTISAWSDGRPRKLADYRRKVVVLDFWGIWCGPCVSAIPTMQKLADRYQPMDVVFLSIHTADGDVAQINKLKKLKGWQSPSGIDSGSSIYDGATCRAYGVTGYPSVVIIDREGKIAFNSGIQPSDVNAYTQQLALIAKEAGVPWPPREDMPAAEIEAIMTSVQLELFGREIERVIDDRKTP